MSDIIDKLRISSKTELVDKLSMLSQIQVHVACSIEDKFNPGSKIEETALITIYQNWNLQKIISQFANDHRKFTKVEKDLQIMYNNRLYQDTTITVQEAGITNGKKITLVSLKDQKSAAGNEGFKLTFWALAPLMVAVAFLIAGLAGTFDTRLRGAYVLLGSIIGVPSFVCYLIGFTEKHSDKTQTAFTGTDWFGDCYEDCCCGCCSCCVTKKVSKQEN